MTPNEKSERNKPIVNNTIENEIRKRNQQSNMHKLPYFSFLFCQYY